MKKKEYNAPMLEIMNCRVERGFAGSGNEGSDPVTTPFTDPEGNLDQFGTGGNLTDQSGSPMFS